MKNKVLFFILFTTLFSCSKDSLIDTPKKTDNVSFIGDSSYVMTKSVIDTPAPVWKEDLVDGDGGDNGAGNINNGYNIYEESPIKIKAQYSKRADNMYDVTFSVTSSDNIGFPITIVVEYKNYATLTSLNGFWYTISGYWTYQGALFEANPNRNNFYYNIEVNCLQP